MKHKPKTISSKSPEVTTCCVSNCSSNSVKALEVSFDKSLKEPSTMKTLLILLGILKQPLKSLKVCFLHYPGAKKGSFSNKQTFNSKSGIDIPENVKQISNTQHCALSTTGDML